MFEGVVAQPGLLCSEDYGYRFFKRKGVGSVVVVVRTCCDNLVSHVVKVVESFRSVKLLNIILMKVKPLGAANNNVGVDVINPFVLNDVDVLNARKVATAKDCARIM